MEWFQVANTLGVGVVFVLGIAVWKLWNKLEEEQGYSRQRDREMLSVLNDLTKVLEMNKGQVAIHVESLLVEIRHTKESILERLSMIEEKGK